MPFQILKPHTGYGPETEDSDQLHAWATLPPGKSTPFPFYTGLRGPEKYTPSGIRNPNRPGRRLFLVLNSLSRVLRDVETHLGLLYCLAITLSARTPALTFPPSCDVHVRVRIHSFDNSRILASFPSPLSIRDLRSTQPPIQ